METIIIVILSLISIFNLYCIFNSSLDWDTSNHLYDAKLKSEKKIFNTNYNFGIKFILPFIYKKFWNIIKNNLKIFRLLNLTTFILTAIFLIVISNLYLENNFAYLVLIFIILNLTIFNPQTSATEFLSTLIALLAYELYIQNNDYLFFSIILILALSVFFKLTDLLFLLPFVVELKILLNENLIILFIFSSIIILSLIFYYKNILSLIKKLKKYFFTRSFKKHIEFNKKNFLIVISILILSYLNLSGSEKFDIYILLSVIIIFIIQRGYISYFYYPLIIFNLYILIKNDNLDLENIFFQLSLFILLIYFLLTLAINLKFRDSELTYRALHYFNFSKMIEKKNDDIFFINIKELVNQNYYLWGSRVQCCLTCKYDQVFIKYFSHNHLLYWSDIEDPKKYCEENCLKMLPEYIIESGVISEIGGLTLVLKSKYKSIFSNKSGVIYKKI